MPASYRSLLGRRRAEFVLQMTDVRQINVLLIHHHPVQLDHGNVGRNGVEAVHDQRVFQQLLPQRRQASIERGEGRAVGDPGFVLGQLLDIILGGAPFVRQRAFIQ